MILFCAPSDARLRGPQDGWIFLGKDLSVSREIERRLGRPAESLKGLLHKESKRLRRPFLDLVASLGQKQTDQIAWWAGTLAWKDAAASDLFLLVCYHALCLRLCTEEKPLGITSLTIVLEDPWLFHQVSRNWPRKAAVDFTELPPLKPFCLRSSVLGLARRFHWLLRMTLSRLRQSWYSRRGLPSLPSRDGIAIYSHIVERTLDKDGGWNDVYMPGLFEELAAAGAQTRRFTDPEVTGKEQELARRREFAAPLILFGAWADLWRALKALPPRTPPAIELESRPIDVLFEREWWHDASRAGRCAYLFFHECARRFLAQAPWKAVVLPWENQPQERMLIAAAREKGVRVAGYQHSTLPTMQLAFFSGPGEAERAFLPDLILASGSYPQRLLKENDVPEEMLRIGGSRRYPDIAKRVPAQTSASPDVLIVLPIDPWQSRHMLEAVTRAYPKGGNGFHFRLKLHPAEPFDAAEIRFPHDLETGALPEALTRCGPVLFSGTTAGLEALQAGHPVLRYRPQLLLDFDPCDMLSDDELPTATDHDLFERLEAVRTRDSRPSERAQAALGDLFAPLDRQAWLPEMLASAAAPAAGRR